MNNQNNISPKRIACVAMCLSFLSLTSFVNGQQELRVRHEAQCPHAVVMLGDVAEVVGADASWQQTLNNIALFPAPVRPTRYTQQQVAEQLAIRGVDLAKMPLTGARSVLVVPVELSEIQLASSQQTIQTMRVAPERSIGVSAVEVAKEKVARVVRTELGKKVNQEADWTVDADLSHDQVLALLEPETRIVGIGGIKKPWVGNFTIRLRVSNDRDLMDFDVPVTIGCDTLAVALAANVTAGQIIRENDLTLSPVLKNTSQSGENLTYNIERIVGMEARRSMRQGQFIQLSMVQTPRVIKKNQGVTVCAYVGDSRVSRPGIAMEEGGIGELIPISFPSTKGTAYGRIVGPGEVEVSMTGIRSARSERSR